MTAATRRESPTAQVRGTIVKSVILIALWVWFFWPELKYIVKTAPGNSDRAHALVAPIAILLLLYLRRNRLVESLSKGSVWGVLLVIAGLGWYAGNVWPFDFTYFRQLAVVPVLAGIVLAAGGWRVLKHCLPMVLLVLLSIPIGQRIYASLIIRPETYTLSATRLALDQLPGAAVKLEGPDFTFARGRTTGTIALGEPRRGATLLIAYASIGAFVVFSRIRPLWQVVTAALAALPIVMFCNCLRLFTWGIVTIYGHANPTSAVPRGVAAIVSLLAAYAIFALFCAVLATLAIEPEPEDNDPGLEPRPNPQERADG